MKTLTIMLNVPCFALREAPLNLYLLNPLALSLAPLRGVSDAVHAV